MILILRKVVSKILFAGVILSALIVVFSCDDDHTSDSFTIGSELVETTTNLVFIDTLAVNMSTVILDSVATSGTDRILVGNNTDGDFGAIKASSYFEFYPASAAVDEEAEYDSLTLVLTYDGYNYGDTLKEQTLVVYPLIEEIESDVYGYLYNTSEFAYNPEPLGHISYTLDQGDEVVEIRLSDSLGKTLFEKLQKDDEDLSTKSKFVDFFPGVVIMAEGDDPAAIVGFAAVDTGTYMNLYYHQVEFEIEEYTAQFLVADEDQQFNHIEVDRTGTVLESWDNQRISISDTATGNRTFMQGATGILTRVEFPGLAYFIEMGDKVSLLKAELVFEPIANTYDTYKIPQNTVLYVSDGINRKYQTVYESDGETVQTGTTSTDYQYHENSYISFDLTSYFYYDLIDNYYDTDYGFLFGLKDPAYRRSFERLILGSGSHQRHQPKLRIYYISDE